MIKKLVSWEIKIGIAFCFMSMSVPALATSPDEFVADEVLQERVPSSDDASSDDGGTVSPELAQQVVTQLKALDLTIEQIGLAINAKVAKVEDKKAVLAHLLNLREVLAYYSGVHSPLLQRDRFEPSSLTTLMDVNDGMLSYLKEAMHNGFSTMNEFDEGKLIKRHRMPIELNPEELQQHLQVMAEDIRQLDREIRHIGYSYLNRFAKRVAHYDKEFYVSSFLRRALPYALTGVYIAWANEHITWGPLAKARALLQGGPSKKSKGTRDTSLSGHIGHAIRSVISLGKGHKSDKIAIFNIAVGAALAPVLQKDLTDLAEWTEREVVRRGVCWLKGENFEDGLPIKLSKYVMNDVVGAEHAKKSLGRIIDYYKARSHHDRAGAFIDRAYFLVGPLDSSRLLAFATAGDVTENYKAKNKSTVMSVYDIHSSELLTKDLKTIIKDAGEESPCIVLIEDLDWLHSQPRVDAKVWADIATQFASILKSKKEVFVMATTRTSSVLAAHYKGQQGLVVHVNMPTEEDRAYYFKRELEKRSILTARFDLAALARETHGCTFLQLTTVINRSVNAAKSQGVIVSQDHLEDAINEVVHGIVLHIPEEPERRLLAAHYAGKVVAHKVILRDEPLKATINPVVHNGKQSSGALIHYTPAAAQTDDVIEKTCVIDLAGAEAQRFLVGTESQQISQPSNVLARIKQIVFKGAEEEHLSQKSREEKLVQVEKLLADCKAKAAHLVHEHEEAIRAIARALEEKCTINDQAIEMILSSHN